MNIPRCLALAGLLSASPGWAQDLTPRPPSSFQLIGTQFGAGAVAAIVTVPAGLLLGSALGTLSNNLYATALPSLLLLAVLPPLAVALAERWAGDWLSPGTHRLLPAVLVGLGVQLLAIVGGVMAGVSSRNFTSTALFTLVEALVLPGAVSLVYWGQRPSGGPPGPAVRSGEVFPDERLTLAPPRGPEVEHAPWIPLLAWGF